MKRTTIAQAVLALALFVFSAVPASASTEMTFVASNGNDANDCSSPAPANACRHISRALTQTDVGGQINCVDSAEYFEATIVNIGQSVTIDCQHASDLPPLVVNTAGVALTVRNLDWASDGPFPAVEFKNGAALILQNVHISGEGGGSAIRFAPASNAQLIVSDCLINNNSGVGILIKPPSGVQATFTIQRTTIQGNQWGIAADGTNGGFISGIVRDSAVSGNTQAGIIAQAGGANVTVSVDNVSVTHNGIGLWATDGTAILTSRSFITGNGTGVQANGSGAVFSYGDNRLNANPGGNGAFSGSVALK